MRPNWQLKVRRLVLRVALVAGSMAALGSLLPVAAQGPGVSATTQWVVTNRGERIATQGPWWVRNQRVVFFGSNGTLASVRLAEIDLEASRDASRGQPSGVGRSAKEDLREPILVLTNKEVGDFRESPTSDAGLPSASVSPASDGVEPARVDAASATAGRQAPTERTLQIDSWKGVAGPDGRGIEVFGTLRNTSIQTARRVAIRVRLYDESAALIETSAAKLARPYLPGKSHTTFRASFPQVASYHRIEFEIEAGNL